MSPTALAVAMEPEQDVALDRSQQGEAPLDPFAPVGVVARRGRPPVRVAERPGGAIARPAPVEELPEGDPPEPARDRPGRVEAVAIAVRTEPHLLGEVVGVVLRAGEAAQQRADRGQRGLELGVEVWHEGKDVPGIIGPPAPGRQAPARRGSGPPWR